MNQILKPEINLNKENTNSNKFNQKNVTKDTKRNKFYKVQFIISSIICFLFIIVFFIRIFKNSNNEQISDNLMSIYKASTLYSNTTDYSTSVDQNLSNTNSFTPFVIGMIKIDKINLNYPILSESNKQLLNISLCRFAGPMPNEIGNLCIAGHNYVDYKFFSRLNELDIGNTIKIYDLSGRMIEYCIYKKYEVEADDITCTSQNTNNKNIITLLTCNNISGKRLVVVAKPL